MSKYHINKKGVPALCKATKGNCPLGEHFKTEKEAEEFQTETMEREHGFLPEVNSESKLDIEERKAFADLIKRVSGTRSAGFDYECYASLSLADEMGLDRVSIVDENGISINLSLNNDKEVSGSAQINRSVEALKKYYEERGITVKNKDSLARVVYYSEDESKGILVQSGGPNVLDAAIVKADEVVDVVEIKKLSTGAQLPSKNLEVDREGGITEEDLDRQPAYLRNAIEHIKIQDADGSDVQVDFGDEEKNTRFPLQHFIEEYKSKGATAFVYTTQNGDRIHNLDLTGDTEEIIDEMLEKKIEANITLRANLNRRKATEDDIYRFNNILSKEYSKSRRASKTDSFTLKSIDPNKISRAGKNVRVGGYILPIEYDKMHENLNKRINKKDLIAFKLTIAGNIKTNY